MSLSLKFKYYQKLRFTILSYCLKRLLKLFHSFSQYTPEGGLVCWKNRPDVHLSKRKLQVSVKLSIIQLNWRSWKFIHKYLTFYNLYICLIWSQSSSWEGEWKEAVWKDVSLILSQNTPLGGFVCTKNIPDDHLSNIKLQVPIGNIYIHSVQFM